MDNWKIEYVKELKKMEKWFKNLRIEVLSVKDKCNKHKERNEIAIKWLNELDNESMTLEEWAKFLMQKESNDEDSKKAKYIITECIWLIIQSKMHSMELDYYNEGKANFLSLINCREEMLKRCFNGYGIDIKQANNSFDTMHWSDLISQQMYEDIVKELGIQSESEENEIPSGNGSNDVGPDYETR